MSFKDMIPPNLFNAMSIKIHNIFKFTPMKSDVEWCRVRPASPTKSTMGPIE